mmetsp:Transcript_41391/g.54464  ORF Transcript_41391/g.54464 Transcript_41391/m.54464 type:complete len:87 (+) Transcript_41391:3781-4041(+)
MAHALAHLAGGDFCIYCAVEASEHLNEDLHGVGAQNLLFLGADHRFVLVAGQFTVGDLGELLYNLLANVLLANIAIVVDEDLQEHH